METLPIATFLAGSILSMTLPIALLIVLAAWHLRAMLRVPWGDASEARRATAAEAAVPPEVVPPLVEDVIDEDS